MDNTIDNRQSVRHEIVTRISAAVAAMANRRWKKTRGKVGPEKAVSPQPFDRGRSKRQENVMSGKAKRSLLFRAIAAGSLASCGMWTSVSYAAETMRCQAYPDGDLVDVPIVGGLLSHGFVSKLAWDENGLGYAICAGKDLYFVAKTGRFIQAFNYDNGPDYFSKKEGLARYIGENGLIGFVDRHLNIVLPARYSAAFPFEAGLARVSFFDGMTMIDGWINRNGQVVSPSQRTLPIKEK